MSWVITKDHINSGADDQPLETGFYFPRSADAKVIDFLRNGGGVEFQLVDDDGIVYFTGRMTQRQFDSDCMDEPLFSWAMPSYGCTMLYLYDDVTKTWQVAVS